MSNFKALLLTVLLILGFAVGWVAFYILVGLLVGYAVFNFIKITNKFQSVSRRK